MYPFARIFPFCIAISALLTPRNSFADSTTESESICGLANRYFERENRNDQHLRFDPSCHVHTNLSVTYSSDSDASETYRLRFSGPALFNPDTRAYEAHGTFGTLVCTYDFALEFYPHGRYLELDLKVPAAINNIFCLPLGKQSNYWTYEETSN